MSARRKRPASAPVRSNTPSRSDAESRPPSAGSAVVAAPRGHSPFSRQAWLIAAGLALLDLVVYAQVRTHAFISLDDGLYVTKNPSIQHGLTWPGIVWAFTTGYAANWHPLTWLSHMLDVQLFGLWSGGHHLTSVGLHVVNTLLLFFGLQWLMPADEPSAVGRSAVVAALFGIHPLHVESVAWVAERKDVLSTCFWWLTIGAYVAYVRKPAMGRYAAVAAMFALGLMAKPMLVTVPLVLLLLDIWPLKRIERPFSLQEWLPLLREKAPLAVLSALSTLVTFVVQRNGGAVIELGHLPFANRLANAVLSYGRYLWKAIWPAHLTVFYSYPIDMPLGLAALSLAVLTAISVAVWRLWPRGPYLAVGWLWFLVTLLPVIGILQVGSQALADRYTYVPLVGILVAVVWGIADLSSSRRIAPIAVTSTACLAIAAYGAACYAEVSYWQNSVTLWQHAIDVMPENYVAYGALAAIRADEGKPAAALDLFQKAVQADPNYPNAHLDLGYQLMQAGRVDEAARQYEAALQLKPDYAEAHQSLGVVLALEGRTAEAVDHYREAIRLEPDLATAHVSLGVSLAALGRMDEAIAEYREGIRLDPSIANGHYRLATAYVASNQTDSAISEFREALRLQPDFPEAHNDLGFLFFALNRTGDAIAEYSAALKSRPAYPEALANRGMALGASLQMPAALADFTEAIRLRPDFETAHYWRGIALAGMGRRDEARNEFQTVLKLDPKNEAARRALEQLGRPGG